MTEKETHDEDKLGSTDSLNANIKAGAENPPRIGGSGLQTRTMTVSCYGYPGDHTNVKPLGGYKWDPARLACAIRGGKVGDSVRIEWKGYDVVAAVSAQPGKPAFLTPVSDRFATLEITSIEEIPWPRFTKDHAKLCGVTRDWYETRRPLGKDTIFLIGFKVVQDA